MINLENISLKYSTSINLNREKSPTTTSKKTKTSKSKSHSANNQVYLTKLCGTKSLDNDFRLATLNHNEQNQQQIIIYNQNLDKVAKIDQETHDDDTESLTNDLNFYKKTSNMLVSCTNNGIVKCWDLRNTHKEVINIDNSSEKRLNYLSVDINSSDSIIAASSATLNDDNDTFVYLYDVRMSKKLLKKYPDAHSNDIVQLKFDLNNENRMITGSLDGLVCLFDLKQMDNEDDDELIDQVYNANSSIDKIGLLDSSRLYAVTLTNELFVWNLETQDQIYSIKSLNDEENSKKFEDCDYIVDCFCVGNEIVCCMANRHGHLRVYKQDKLIYMQKKGENSNDLRHCEIVRGAYFNNKHQNLFTIGEDGLLCKWNFVENETRNTAAAAIDATIEEKETVKNEKNNKKRSIHDDSRSDEDEDERKREFKRRKKHLFNKKNKNKKRVY